MSYLLVTLLAVLALLALGYLYEAAREAHDRRCYPPPGKFVEAAGRRIHLLVQGDAPGPTVVIEQGCGSPSLVWWSVQAAIAQFARVVTYDRAGYLWSDATA